MPGSVWAMKSGDTIATQFANVGDAVTYVGSNGLIQLGPGNTETIPAHGAGVLIHRLSNGLAERDGFEAFKGGPWFDVRAFGAKGDNSTDDKANIQLAIDAVPSGGGTVFLPHGIYLISNKLTIAKSGVRFILARGAVLKAKAGFPGATTMLQGGDASTVYQDFWIEGGKFDGNSLAQHCINVTGPNKHVTVVGVEATLSLITAINVTGVSVGNPAIGVVVRDCYVHDTSEGIQAVYATDVQITGNRVYDMSGGSPSQDCIEVARVRRFVIANNLCRNPASTNAAIDVFEDCQDGVVDGNVCTRSSAVNSQAIIVNSTTVHCFRVVVSNNVIAGGFGVGIGVGPGNEEVQIVGNLIRDMDLTDTSKGMEIQGDDVAIVGNRIMRTQSAGIDIIGAIDSVRVLNNDIIDAGLGSFGIQAGVNIGSGSATNIVVKGNRFNNTPSPGPQFHINNTAGCAVLVEDNELRGNVSTGRQINNQNDAGLTAHRNTGFVTENSGTATITSGNTSIAVNHGLSKTPALQHISVVLTNNPTTAPGHIWLSAVGATQFTINVLTNPGASGANFAWHVAVIP